MNARNRVPWIVAAAAMLFAMIVLVRNEVTPEGPAPYDQGRQQPVIQAQNSDWRPSRGSIPTPVPPKSGDYSPWSTAPQPTPAGQTPTPAPPPTPSPSPAPTPTPKPAYVFRGVVTDDAGKPVARALVRTISGGTDQAAERSAVSDAEGKFKIEDIPDDKLDKVIVEGQGHSVTMLENIPLPLNQEIQIGLSALAGIDALVLDFSTTSSEPVLFSGKMQASLLRLSRKDEADTGSLGISEPVLPVDTYLPIRDQSVVVVDGLLQFDNVEPGRYRVAVKTGIKVAESEMMDVKENARTSTTLTLGMKHTVRGSVVGEDTAAAVSQARVTLAPARQGTAAPEFPEYLSFTDGAGEFVIPEVQPGTYWMVVGAAGYTTKTLDNFVVQPGAPPEDTSVTLIKQNPLITVSVTNGEGRPMAQAPLVLMTMSAPTPRTYFGKSDEAGLFRFENLMAGRYNLSVTAPGDRTRQKTLPITLGEGEVKEMPVRFGNSAIVTGKVTRGGKPYKGVISFVLRGAAMADNLITADESGAYKADLEPGEYMVGTPDKPSAQLVTIESKETQNLNLELK